MADGLYRLFIEDPSRENGETLPDLSFDDAIKRLKRHFEEHDEVEDVAASIVRQGTAP